MLWKLILLLTAVPLVELYLLVWLTRLWDSFLLTVALILATGVVGATLTRLEGLKVLEQINRQLRSGQLPTDSLLDGVLILLAGALLITPGVLTDGVGFMLVVPFTRVPARNLLKRWLRDRVEVHRSGAFTEQGFHPIDPEPPPGFPPLEDEDEAEE